MLLSPLATVAKGVKPCLEDRDHEDEHGRQAAQHRWHHHHQEAGDAEVRPAAHREDPHDHADGRGDHADDGLTRRRVSAATRRTGAVLTQHPYEGERRTVRRVPGLGTRRIYF